MKEYSQIKLKLKYVTNANLILSAIEQMIAINHYQKK
jgi:hypothetical protein